MDRAQIAHKLHLMVDDWEREADLCDSGPARDYHLTVRVTYEAVDDPANRFTLVVGTEPGGEDIE